MEKKQLKQLKKAYNKSFNILNEQLFTSRTAGLDIFIEHLKYVRDMMILSTDYDIIEAEKNAASIATLVMAIAEYEASIYSVEQKSFHWNNFCELLRENMEDWLELNDSI